MVTNLVNDKIYIGKTKKLSQRWYYHCYDAMRGIDNMALHKAIRKYGKHNFSVESILIGIPNDKVDFYEQMMIRAFGSTNPDIGYNISTGGVGGNGLIGEKNGMYGKKRPDLSERNRLGKGRTYSDERKKQISIQVTGRKHTQETKTMMSEKRKERLKSGAVKINPEKTIQTKLERAKLIKCNETGVVYRGTTEAARKLNLPKGAAGNIGMHLAGKLKTCYGYTFVIMNPVVN